MDDTNFNFRLSELTHRTEEQSEQIRDVLEQISPIECDLIGEKTVKAISRGANFESVEGGRHMSFLETISLLSGMATLIQFAMLVIVGLKSKFRKNHMTNAEAQEEVKEVIKEKISNHPELGNLSNLIAKDPVILGRIVAILLLETGPQKSD